MNWNNNYPFLVWISTLLLGPMFYFTFLPVNKAVDFASIFQLTFYFFVFGFLFSAPAFVIYLLLFRFLLRDNLPLFATKILASLIAVATLVFTLYIVGGVDFDEDTYKFIFSYAVPIIISSFAFKLTKSKLS